MISTYRVNIENINGNLTGYIIYEQDNNKSETDNFIHLDNISFNPLTILGDLLFIANDMDLPNDKIPTASIDKDILFESPYPIESCFDINVEHDYQYFSLLNYLKKVITDDQKQSFIQVHNIGMYFKIALNYNFSYEDEKQQSNDFISYSPMVFGLSEINDILTISERNHIYTCSCSSLSEIVFSIFNYLMLFDYHFYKCKHCKKYSAIKRKQGVPKYCNRLNVLGLTGNYENLSCKEAIPKLLDCIRKNKKKSYNYLYNNYEESDTEDFKNGYKEINNLVKLNPSAENLLKLKKYVDNNSVKILKKKGE